MTPHNLPQKPSTKFVPSAVEISEIHQILEQDHQVAIFGISGIGKTRLCLEYAYNYLSSYEGGICWVFGDNDDVDLQLKLFCEKYFNLRPEDGYLLIPDGKFLLIVDNLKNPELMSKYLSTNLPNFKIIVNRVNQESLNIPTISLQPLSLPSALMLLSDGVNQGKISPSKGQGFAKKLPDDNLANYVCESLEYLPQNLQNINVIWRDKKSLSVQQIYNKIKQNIPLELIWLELDESSQKLAVIFSFFALFPIPWEQVESVLGQLYLPSAMMSKLLDKNDSSDGDIEVMVNNFLQSWQFSLQKLLQFNLIQVISQDVYILHEQTKNFLQEKITFIDRENDLKTAFIDVMLAVAKQIPENFDHELLKAIYPAIPHIKGIICNWKNIIKNEDLQVIYQGLNNFYFHHFHPDKKAQSVS
jgi:hypothetical protein